MITLEYNTVEKSLADWGFAEDAKLTLGNQTEDILSLTLVGANYAAAPLIPFEATVKLRSNRTVVGGALTGGIIEFTGARLSELVDARPENEGIRYTFAGPWYHLSRTLYQQQFAMLIGGVLIFDYQSEILLFTRLDVTTGYVLASISNGQQITDILQGLLTTYAAQSMTAPYQIGTIDPALFFPSLWCKPMMSSDAIQKCLELSPDVKVYFDYTFSPPKIHVRQQSALPSTTLAIANGTDHVSLRIKSLPDMVARAVVVRYRITSTLTGVTYISYSKDKFGPTGANNIADPDGGLRVVVETVDLLGMTASNISASILTEPVASAGGTQASKRAWWSKVDNIFEDTRLRFQDSAHAQTTIPDATIIDEDTVIPGVYAGDIVSLSAYPNRLLDGAVSPWMTLAGVPVVAKRCKFVSAMTYAQYDVAATGGSDTATNGNKLHQYEKKEHHVQMTLTNGISATYTALASFAAGEAVPTGIAQAVYQSLATLQYEGEYVKVQTDISGGISMGNNLNLSNGRAEWATMNAQIQSIRKDFGTGITEVQVGIAKHLGILELANLLRMWRYRRVWQNPLVRQSGQSSSGGSVEINKNVPKHNTHSGIEEASQSALISEPDGSGSRWIVQCAAQ